MKIEIDLEKLPTGADWDETVAQLIRDEIVSCIRAAVKESIKSERKRISESVMRAAKLAAEDMKVARIKNIAGKMLENM